MTKKDFELIAATIQSADCDPMRAHPYAARWARNAIAREFARVLANVNPRFDRERFLRACGAED